MNTKTKEQIQAEIDNLKKELEEKEKIIPALEEEFKRTVEVARVQIQEKCAAARKALNEAVAISEQYGVPFSEGICFISNTYTPKSFQKFQKLEREFFEEFEIYIGYNWGYYGWEHSAVC